jgi:glutamate dehydrogenase
MDSGAAPVAPLSLESLLAAMNNGDWPAFGPKGKPNAEAKVFVTQYWHDIGPDEFAGLSAGDVLAMAHSLWAWSGALDTAQQHVRLVEAKDAAGAPLSRTLLEVVGPDMEFLVDSVMGEVTAQGLTPLAMVHPILSVNRDASGKRVAGRSEDAKRESVIQVHLAPLGAQRGEALIAGVRETLSDVRIANADFPAMKARMHAAAEELKRARTNATVEEASEAVAFLNWLSADHFTFLGVREYEFPRDPAGNFLQEEPTILTESGLGLLRDPERFVLRRASEPAILTTQLENLLNEASPLVVAKSNLMNRVHRRIYADYVGVKRYGKKGEVIGETRFIGLFTAEAYTKLTRDVPLLRQKVAAVFARSGKTPQSHSGKVLLNILENYPRDELFQITEDELLTISQGILHLADRPRPRAFIRRDRLNRFVTAMAFIPRDRFNSTVRMQIGEHIAGHYKGRVSAFYPQFNDSALARILFIIGGIDRAIPDPDSAALDAAIASITRNWEDAFVEAAQTSDSTLSARYSGAFPVAYRDKFDAREALIDAGELEKLTPQNQVRVRAFPSRTGAGDRLGCKIYVQGIALPLSAVVPILENMGLFVETEYFYPVARGADGLGVHDVDMRARDGKPIDAKAVEDSFEEAFAAIWNGEAENDGFNRLILKLGVSWREAALIRALARYRQQTGLDPTQAVQEQALADYPEIVRQILALFRVRFSPEFPEPVADRRAWVDQIQAKIEDGLKAVVSLDADRALRRIAALVSGILRTNYYQRGADGKSKSYMSFKIASPDLEDLPLPRPYREIWVSSPEVEGIHLRFGPVARGGLRWSDRRDDFRTEVLDLVKAQQVKNAIIVPVGAKGGFFPKRLPARGAPGFQETGVSAYKTFLRGLLDITDNIVAAGVKPPTDVVRWDNDDPYLVVAADKGTATFSDIANGISVEYGHWLGDAFASGGSVGYDHKGMGITARGGWEAVKRHFREIGKDIQSQDFTVIGVGDMSGDVFGNGMLLSKHIRLVAAFDHRDIFLDPNPDAAKSWVERKRLFDLPRSSWRDYDAKLISKGGGVFSRSEKSIPLSAEVRELTGLAKEAVTPSELMAALLKAPCELLWFGGIGTYVKAASETHAEAGDKANDAHRVDAEDVRASVVGEGANLGLTQAGRIAFARKGGRINTDAVDNSAGVDTSDHEVNIKILLADAEASKTLAKKDREPLLEAMTDDVAKLVLRNNYDQTRALSVAEASAAADLDACERFMERLERAGKLVRSVEGLPSAGDIRNLRAKQAGLTRPEYAKLIAYAKIDAFDAIVAGTAPDDPHFDAALKAYFPKAVEKFTDSMKRHRLRREIIATGLANDMVNYGGPTFVDRVRDIARASSEDVARAFEVARAVFGLERLSDRIDALDNKAPAALQMKLYQEIANLLRRVCLYLVRHGAIDAKGIGAAIANYQPGVSAQARDIWETMSQQERHRAAGVAQVYISEGAPEDLAREAAALSAMSAALDIADLSRRTQWSAGAGARMFRAVGAVFGIDRIRASASVFRLEQHWDRLALRRTLEALYDDQRVIAEAAIKTLGACPADEKADMAWADGAMKAFLVKIEPRGSACLSTIAELESGGAWTFAKAILAAAEIKSLGESLQS